MKKFIIVCALLLVPFLAKAEVPVNTYFFGDGKGYNENGDQKYFCFSDGSCYSLEGVFAFVREVQNTLVNLQNQVNNLQTSINMSKNQIAAGTSELITEEISKQQIPQKDPIFTATPTYFMVEFSDNQYVQLSTSKLIINGTAYENGKINITRKGVGSYIIFDLSLEPGTYPYTFTISNDNYEGTFNGEVIILAS